MKSYHEIRFNINDTNYIPNLDKMSLEEKIKIISILKGVTDVEIYTWSIESIENEFMKLLAKEFSELEQDVGAVS